MIKVIIASILVGLAIYDIYSTIKTTYQGTKEAMDRSDLTFYQIYKLLSDDYNKIFIQLTGNLLVIVYVYMTLI